MGKARVVRGTGKRRVSGPAKSGRARVVKKSDPDQSRVKKNPRAK